MTGSDVTEVGSLGRTPVRRALTTKGEIRRAEKPKLTVLKCFLCLRDVGPLVFAAPVRSATCKTITAALCPACTSPTTKATAVMATCEYDGRRFGYQPKGKPRRYCCHVCRVLGRRAQLRAQSRRGRESRGW
jgi:hypothetical protein